MILHIPQVLSAAQVEACRTVLARAEWVDGRVTAGEQSGLVKRNLQLSESAPEARELGQLVLTALSTSAHFMSAALPLRVFPPLFNRYGVGMSFGAHIDNAVRTSPATGVRFRTDLSCTLFLSAIDSYNGGELVIGEQLEQARIKLPAGDMVVYPSTTVHRVEPVTRGERWASFFWLQSMVADQSQRTLLYGMDRAITAARADLGDGHEAAVALTGSYHNLLRMWSQI